MLLLRFSKHDDVIHDASYSFQAFYVSSTLLWNSSWADTIPKGRLRKRYLPNVVLNVVSSEDSSLNWIAQYPDLESRMLKYFAPANLDVTSSSVGSG